MLHPLAKKSEKNIEKFRRKLSKRRIFVLKTVGARTAQFGPNLGQTTNFTKRHEIPLYSAYYA